MRVSRCSNDTCRCVGGRADVPPLMMSPTLIKSRFRLNRRGAARGGVVVDVVMAILFVVIATSRAVNRVALRWCTSSLEARHPQELALDSQPVCRLFLAAARELRPKDGKGGTRADAKRGSESKATNAVRKSMSSQINHFVLARL